MFVCCKMFSPVGDPCIIQAPCQNGGVCNNTAVGEFECDCPREWAGIMCDQGNHQNFLYHIILVMEHFIVGWEKPHMCIWPLNMNTE